jgi:hypothetical protein
MGITGQSEATNVILKNFLNLTQVTTDRAGLQETLDLEGNINVQSFVKVIHTYIHDSSHGVHK